MINKQEFDYKPFKWSIFLYLSSSKTKGYLINAKLQTFILQNGSDLEPFQAMFLGIKIHLKFMLQDRKIYFVRFFIVILNICFDKKIKIYYLDSYFFIQNVVDINLVDTLFLFNNNGYKTFDNFNSSDSI